ncbi:hypothetical protein RJT34_19400 [Clitoria ternatea]|uniref:Uncharacterized protein n=1 Tax=Clitoria ternatea TaxID=43366 RepID=A0AAN9IQY7_CLITE
MISSFPHVKMFTNNTITQTRTCHKHYQNLYSIPSHLFTSQTLKAHSHSLSNHFNLRCTFSFSFSFS